MASLKPWPCSPSRAKSSSTTLSKKSSRCGVPRRPIIIWSLPTVKPGRPLSTMNMLISFSPVFAETRKKSDQMPSLMKCLLPLSTHWP